MPGMCIAQVSAAIEAYCHGITVARIGDGLLQIRYFDNSANVVSHTAFLSFFARGRNQSTPVACQRLSE